MSDPSLLLGSLVALTAASAYAYVGHRLSLRRVAVPQDRRPLSAFAFWWNAVAVNIALGAALFLAASFGWTSFPAQLAYAYLQRILLPAALVGLMYYLSFLLTGRGFVWFWTGFYTLTCGLLIYALAVAQPDGVLVGDWRTDVSTANEAPTWVSLVNLAAIVMPPVIGALGYFTLFFRLREERDTLRRFRVLVVSLSLILWWVVAVLAGQRASLANEELQFINRFLGLVFAAAILVAYEPPSFLRRWLTHTVDGAAVTPAVSSDTAGR